MAAMIEGGRGGLQHSQKLLSGQTFIALDAGYTMQSCEGIVKEARALRRMRSALDCWWW